MVFVGFLVIIHPWFSLNWLKIYRAQKIKGEEGDYTAYFGQEKKYGFYSFLLKRVHVLMAML